MERYDSKWGNLLKDRVAPIDEKIRKIMFRGETNAPAWKSDLIQVERTKKR